MSQRECNQATRSYPGRVAVRLVALVALAATLSGCGVGGLLGGVAAGVLLSIDDSSSSSSVSVVTANLSASPSREGLRSQGNATLVPLCFELRGAEETPQASVEYTLTGSGEWFPATPHGDSLPGFSCDSEFFCWDATEDLDLADDLGVVTEAAEVRLRVFSSDHPEGAATTTPLLVGNTPPQIQFLPITDTTGAIRLWFTLKDAEDDPILDVTFHYQLPVTQEWELMAVEGLSSARVEPGEHFVVWDSRVKLGGRRIPGLTIRLRARDHFGGGVEETIPDVLIENNEVPIVLAYKGPSGAEGESFEVPFSFQIIDFDGHLVDVVIQYLLRGQDDPPLLDEEVFGDPVARRMVLDFGNDTYEELRRELQIAVLSGQRAGQRTTELEASAAGVEHFFLWDTAADVDPLQGVPARIRATPFDEQRGIAPDVDLELFVNNDRYPLEPMGLARGEGSALGVAIGDLDGDRRGDLAVSLPEALSFPNDPARDQESGRVEVFLRQADGSLPPSATFSLVPGPPCEDPCPGAARGPGQLSITDLDGDGLNDLVVLGTNCRAEPNCDAMGEITIFYGSPQGLGEPSPEGGSGRCVLRAGSDVRSLAVGNFDGQAGPDLAVSNHVDETVDLHLNVAEGRESPPWGRQFTRQDPPVGVETIQTQPGIILAADFDGDGVDDLAVRERERDTGVPGSEGVVDVFRGVRTDPHLELAAVITAGLSQPVSLAAGDFNLDGLLDLAIGNRVRRTISVFLQESPFSFELCSTEDCQPIPVQDPPETLIAADLSGDGFPELVAFGLEGEGLLNRVELLSREQAGGRLGRWRTFKSFFPLTFAREFSPSGAVGDLDGDGRPDILVGTTEGALLYRAEGEGSLVPRLGWSLDVPAGSEPRGVVLGDLNGDQRKDVAVGLKRTGEVLVFHFKSQLGGFSANHDQTLRTGPEPTDLALAELVTSGGRKVTLLAVGRVDGNRPGGVEVYARGEGCQTGSGWCKVGSLAEAGLDPQPIIFGDFGGHGSVDLLRLGAIFESGLYLWTLNLSEEDEDLSVEFEGVGPFDDGGFLSLPFTPISVAVGDLEKDQLLDLALLATDGNVHLLRQRPPGEWPRFEDVLVIPTNATEGAVHLADIGSDGYLDLIVVATFLNRAFLYRQEPGKGGEGPFVPSFGRPQELEPGLFPSEAVVCDLTGEGLLDIAINAQQPAADGHVNVVTVFYQLPDGSFPRHPSTGITVAETGLSRIMEGDLSGDSRPELLLAPVAGDAIRIVRTR